MRFFFLFVHAKTAHYIDASFAKTVVPVSMAIVALFAKLFAPHKAIVRMVCAEHYATFYALRILIAFVMKCPVALAANEILEVHYRVVALSTQPFHL